MSLQNLADTPASLSLTTPWHCHMWFLANPCWLKRECSGCTGAPKQGNTIGIPPRTAFVPSNLAFDETNRRSTGVRSLPFEDFHDMTVAPYNSISALAPCSSHIVHVTHIKVMYLRMREDDSIVKMFKRHWDHDLYHIFTSITRG